MIETKVKRASLAAPLTVVALYLLQLIPAVDAMPDPVKAALAALVTALVTFGVSYQADHTDRPDLGYEPKHAPDDGGYSTLELLVGALVVIILVVILFQFLPARGC